MSASVAWAGTVDEFAARLLKVGMPEAIPCRVLGVLVADHDLRLWRGEDGRVNLSIAPPLDYEE